MTNSRSPWMVAATVGALAASGCGNRFDRVERGRQQRHGHSTSRRKRWLRGPATRLSCPRDSSGCERMGALRGVDCPRMGLSRKRRRF